MTNGNKDYTSCHEAFEKWLIEVKEVTETNLNEADTRGKIIDPLLKALGWEDQEIDREGYINDIGYFDYKLSSNKNSMILEAKKETVPFVMPNTKAVKYSTLSGNHSGLYGAISQAVNYATTKKINVVVACNGCQFAITYLPYTNIPTYNDTYLINGLVDLQNSFINIWNILSPIQNSEEHLPKLLVKDKMAPILRTRPTTSDKISASFPDSDHVLSGNSLSDYLEHLMNKYFVEITSDKEMLQKCYISFDGLHQYEKEIESFLRDTAPELGIPIEEIETTKKSPGKIGESLNQGTQLFVLTGGPGVGKTTFIHRWLNFLIPEEEKESLIWLYLDFNLYTENLDLDKFVYETIEEQLLDVYEHLQIFEDIDKLKALFAKDIRKSKAELSLLEEVDRNKELYNIIKKLKDDKPHFVKRVFEYIKTLGLGTCLIYDNVDQHNFGIQRTVFHHANALRGSLNSPVVLSLREEVVYNHQYDKSFNFSECKIFHIPAPKVKNVLSKRFGFIKEKISGDERLQIENNSGATIDINTLDIINVLVQTFLGVDKNATMYEMISNRNMRQALNLFKRTISSRNLDFDTLILSAGMYATGLREVIFKEQELLLGLALGNRKHYSGDESTVLNLFEIQNDGFFSHLTKIRILSYAKSRIHVKLGSIPKGYFSIREMYQESFRRTVNNMDNFLNICKTLQRVGCLINLNGSISEINEKDFVKLGAVGNYYLTDLLGNPFYLFLVAIDTPITKVEVYNSITPLYEKILNSTEGNAMKEKRMKRIACTFAKYLFDSEQEEVEYLDKIQPIEDSEGLYKTTEYLKQSLIGNIDIDPRF